MKPTNRFYEIDLLRFVAACAVLLFHYTFRGAGPDHRSDLAFPALAPIFKYGYLGVELFFIISGFVILLTALDRNAREFIVSRIVRLYPAYWTCVTATFLAILALGGTRYTGTWFQYLFNLTMLQEFARVPPIDGVYWTLTVELKFYFLVFLLVVTRLTSHLQHFLAAWLLCSVFLSHTEGLGVARFFLFPGYSYFFIAGAAFLLIRLRGATFYRLLLVLISYVEAVRFSIRDSGQLVAFFGSDFNPIVIATLITCFFGIFALLAWGKTGFLDRRAFLTVGALTYPLYLLHQNVGFMVSNLLAPYVPAYAALVLVTALVLGLAYCVHRWIESRYARRLKRLLERLFRLPQRKGAEALVP